jgi:glycosyltransferase involved in cell wall biosynthesis
VSLRILICSNFYLPDAVMGGVPTATQYLAQALWDLGHDVSLLVNTQTSPGYVEPDPFPVLRGITPERLRRQAQAVDVVIVASDALSILTSIGGTATPYVIIHHRERAGCPSGTAVRDGRICRPGPLKCWGCRVPTNGEASPPSIREVVRRTGRYLTVRYYLQRAAANICLSQRSIQLLHAPHAHLIPNPIPPKFSPAENRRIADQPFRLACISRLDGEKNIGFVLDLMTEFKPGEFHLDVYGDGPQRRFLEQQARNRGLADHTVFHGVVTGPALIDAYRRAGLVLIPSDFEESFCLVAAEALMCGTPVVASNRGALPETVGPGGYTVSLSDPPAWLDAIRQIRASPDLYQSLRDAGLRHVQTNFASEGVGRQYEELLLSIVDKKASKHPAGSISS